MTRGPVARRGRTWATFGLIALGVAIGIACTGATTWMVNATSSVDFCATACHSMQWAAAAYEQGPHFKNTSGVRASCGDCHIPFESQPATPFQYVFGTLWTKGIVGTEDVIATLRGTIADKKKWDAERPRLGKKVREWFKATNGATCQGCHKLDAFKKTGPSAFMASEFHAGRIKPDKIDCLECHSDVAHVWPSAAAN